MCKPLEFFEHDISYIELDRPSDAFLEFLFPKERNRDQYKCFSISKVEEKHRIEFSYFIGVDWVVEGRQAIYVQPKLNREKYKLASDYSSGTDYLKMLFNALKHPEVLSFTDELFYINLNSPHITISRKQDQLTPLLVIQFLRLVKEIVRKGLKKTYYRIETNLHSRIKGKILVSKTIKENILKSKRLNAYCSYEEFGFNGLENRLLKKALMFIQRYLSSFNQLTSFNQNDQSISGSISEIFNYILPAFANVSDEVSLSDIKHVKTNVFYKGYAEAIRLAKIILQRFGYNITNTQNEEVKTPPFWIDMSKLFELFVLGLLKDRFKAGVYYHLRFKGNELDYLINTNEYQIIADAKYKPIYQENGKWDIENIRQLSGYARLADVYNLLAKKDNEVISCLIIYPDQNEGNKTLLDVELLHPDNEMPDFIKFFKVGVSLPIMK